MPVVHLQITRVATRAQKVAVVADFSDAWSATSASVRSTFTSSSRKSPRRIGAMPGC
jgi:phenylpyruvate tautomerase PptA (4-oxalocrotonate tautomerase family)